MLISTHIIIHNKFTFLFFHDNDKATKVRKYINSFICYIILTFPHISVIPSKSIFSSNTTQLIKQKETFKCYRKRIFHALDRTGFFFLFLFHLWAFHVVTALVFLDGGLAVGAWFWVGHKPQTVGCSICVLLCPPDWENNKNTHNQIIYSKQ